MRPSLWISCLVVVAVAFVQHSKALPTNAYEVMDAGQEQLSQAIPSSEAVADEAGQPNSRDTEEEQLSQVIPAGGIVLTSFEQPYLLRNTDSADYYRKCIGSIIEGPITPNALYQFFQPLDRALKSGTLGESITNSRLEDVHTVNSTISQESYNTQTEAQTVAMSVNRTIFILNTALEHSRKLLNEYSTDQESEAFHVPKNTAELYYYACTSIVLDDLRSTLKDSIQIPQTSFALYGENLPYAKVQKDTSSGSLKFKVVLQ